MMFQLRIVVTGQELSQIIPYKYLVIFQYLLTQMYVEYLVQIYCSHNSIFINFSYSNPPFIHITDIFVSYTISYISCQAFHGFPVSMFVRRDIRSQAGNTCGSFKPSINIFQNLISILQMFRRSRNLFLWF